jgi:transposase
LEEWIIIIWSDECSVERGAGARRSWVFRIPGQKWDKEMVDTFTKGKDISVMVWGAIWVGSKSDLFIMNRDEASKKGGYSARLYLEVLNDQLPTIFSPGMIFMQDNAPIHRAGVIKD